MRAALASVCCCYTWLGVDVWLMGKSVIVIGTQWGDEGKGKIVDLLTERAAAVVRFQGGHNAGHTLLVGGEKTDANAARTKGPQLRIV